MNQQSILIAGVVIPLAALILMLSLSAWYYHAMITATMLRDVESRCPVLLSLALAMPFWPLIRYVIYAMEKTGD